MSSSSRPPTLHLVCSRGGHLDVLLSLREAFAGFDVVWITQQSDRAEALRRAGERVRGLGEYSRGASLPATARTVWRSIALVARERPRLLVTSGAGIAVPFCVLARLAGAYVVFVETSARVRGASSSGRVLSRIANHVIAQWEEMRTVYPGATIARSNVVQVIATRPPVPGEGTFVGVGTHSQPFDRLLAMADRAIGAGLLPRPALIQTGPSTLSIDHAESREFVTPDEMEARIRSARFVVCHAGSGTLAGALRAGRRPLVLARLERHGEHFDDHQQQLVDKLASLDLAVPLGDEITSADLARADRPLRVPDELERLPPLLECVRDAVRRKHRGGRARA